MKAVVFDIDGTLSPDISWTKLTLLLGASVPDHLKIYEDFKNGNLEYEESKKALLRLWRGDGEVSKKKLREIFSCWTLKEGVVPLFAYLRSKGYITCLITGSVDLFAHVIAEKVGADAWYANTALRWDHNDYLQDYDYERNAAEKKLEQFKNFCEQHSFKPTECVVVGDDANDIELFKASGHGIAVESPTSSVLDEFAWKKIRTLSEVKGIV